MCSIPPARTTSAAPIAISPAAEDLPDNLDAHVVGARPPEDALLAGAAEGRADAVDEDDFPVHAVRLRDMSWHEHIAREQERYRDGEARLDEAADADTRQRQL